MAVMNRVRRGEVVALRHFESVTYALGSGRGTERTVRYTLAIVNGANKRGEATSLRRRSGTVLYLRRTDYGLDDVQTIPKDYQAAAAAVFKGMSWDSDSVRSEDCLRNLIRSAGNEKA